MLPYREEGGGLHALGAGGRVVTHSAGFVTTQSKAFTNVMASEPYSYTWYLKQVMAGLPYTKIYIS